MSQFIVALFERFVREEEGQDMVEYALLLGLISIVAVAAIILAGDAVNALWEAVTTALTDALPA